MIHAPHDPKEPAARRGRRGQSSKDRAPVFTNDETKRVLIADDSRDYTDGLGVLLADLGYSVRTAYDGRDAIEAARKFQPHVVILDVLMPGMTGFEAGRVFSRHPAQTRPVMIAVTGWPEEEGKTRAAQAGFDHYLSKAAGAAPLLELLKKLWP